LFAINKTGIREFISKIQYFSDNYLWKPSIIITSAYSGWLHAIGFHLK
jgi:hypothetical protein